MTTRTIMLTVATVLLVTPLGAQEDFRHVDEGRPVHVEDAYPIKFREWEWELGLSAEGLEGGTREVESVLELKTGILRNAQVGLELHGVLERAGGVSETGLESFAGHVLYNLNQEGRRAPAFGLRLDVASPGIGELGHNDPSVRLKAMLTRGVGASRVHLNGGYRWSGAADGGDVTEVGVALDRTWGLTSRLLVGDVFLEIPESGRTRVRVDVGARLQWSKQTVVDLGVGSRLDTWDDGVPNLGLTVGVSRASGIRALVPDPSYPNPRLR